MLMYKMCLDETALWCEDVRAGVPLRRNNDARSLEDNEWALFPAVVLVALLSRVSLVDRAGGAAIFFFTFLGPGIPRVVQKFRRAGV